SLRRPDVGIMSQFMAFDSAFRGGVTVAAGDTNGDGRSDIVTGAGPNGGPNVRVFDGTSLATLQTFNAFPAGFRGGGTVAPAHLDGNGRADLVVGCGSGMAGEIA